MPEIPNREQAAAWDGEEGDDWTEWADRYEQSSASIAEHLDLEELIGTGDSVLDVGCGTGLATLRSAEIARSGHALGVDLSTRMLAYAAERAVADGVTNVRYERADAQVHRFDPASFDVLISKFGVMFFDDPTAAWSNLAAALRPGGRLAVLVWRRLDENAWLMGIRQALALGRDLPAPPPEAPTPFALADPDRVRRLLGTAGLDDIQLTPVDEQIVAGRDADDAHDWIGSSGVVRGLLDGIDEAGRQEGHANLRAYFEQHETDAGVLLPTASWLITATRAG